MPQLYPENLYFLPPHLPSHFDQVVLLQQSEGHKTQNETMLHFKIRTQMQILGKVKRPDYCA